MEWLDTLNIAQTPLTVLVLGMALGMVHALDADHVMTVTSLAARRGLSVRVFGYGACWALGHGLTLLILGCCVFLLGFAIPESLHVVAEMAVALLLIAIGLALLRDMATRRMRIAFHRHDDVGRHAHWYRDGHHRHEITEHGATENGHAATLMGVLHGAAGSAPILALLPAAQQRGPAYAIAYLLCFSFGVGLAMLLFSGALGHLGSAGERIGPRIVHGLNMAVGGAATLVGAYMLVGLAGYV